MSNNHYLLLQAYAMQTGQGVGMIDDQQWALLFSWTTTNYHGELRNKKQFQRLQLKRNIMY